MSPLLAWMLAFSAGVAQLSLWTGLPAWAGWISAIGALAAHLLPRHRWIGGFLFGVCWAFTHASIQLEHRWPASFAKQAVTVQGYVVGLPKEEGFRHRFDFRVVSGDDIGAKLPRRLRLSWYQNPPELRPGDLWKLEVKLKPPRGYANPGGFDYERYLFFQRIDALGYVVAGHSTGVKFTLDRFRDQASSYLRQLMPDSNQGVLLALTLGDRRYLSTDQRDLLRDTGTAHLLAISGMHVALVAGAFGLLVAGVWRLVPRLACRWPTRLVGAFSGAVAALCYATMAGWSLPTQRAVIMVMVGAVFIARFRHGHWFHAWIIALAAVLLLQPMAPLDGGFWLSFIATAFVILVARGLPRQHAAKTMVGLQWRLSLALLPVIWLTFSEVPWLSPLANLLAVPVVSLLVLPMALLGAIAAPWPALSALCFGGASEVVAWLFGGLAWLAEAPRFEPSELGAWQAWILVLVSIWLVLPKRLFAVPMVCLVLAALSPRDLRPPAHELYVDMIDVGQGNAVLVRTATHALLYDAGDRYPSGFDLGEQVVAPALTELGVRELDMLLISHGDSDHAGGAGAIMERFHPAERLTGEPERLPGSWRRCRAGRDWRWGETRFSVLWPRTEATGNNASCVLLIEHGSQKVLLTGDIEARVERAMLADPTVAERLSGVTVMTVPHHGSESSSTAAFVARTRPRLVLNSAGAFNQWDFPRSKVVTRYRAVGARMLNTADSGMVSLRIHEDDGAIDAQCWRQAARRYYRAAAVAKGTACH